MEKKKRTGIRIEGAENMIVIGNISAGFEEGYVIKDIRDSFIGYNHAISDESMRIFSEIDKAIKDNEREIKEQLGEEKLNEIINILNELQKGKPTPPSQVMERMLSLGANALTIWPLIESLINSL